VSQSTLDLAKLFGVALNTVNSNREKLNSMDENNHPNHGDNVTHNLGIIKEAFQSQQGQSPTDAMRYAAQRLTEQGRGSTAPQYSQGLMQAATHFEGQQSLSNNDMGLLLHRIRFNHQSRVIDVSYRHNWSRRHARTGTRRKSVSTRGNRVRT
jgi:hypothetical protein